MRFFYFLLILFFASQSAFAETCRTDQDCDDGIFCNGVEACFPAGSDSDARGCRYRTPPCNADVCFEPDRQCRMVCANGDADGDGVDSIACGGTDCDDNDPHRYPGNSEICDGQVHDEDCDPNTFGDKDSDGDGYLDFLCTIPRGG